MKGSVYFRHGAKSEPGTTDDLRWAIERQLEKIKGFWLDGIGKVVAAPVGSEIQIVQQAIALRDSADATSVQLTADAGAPRVSINNVAFRDAPDATAIRLTNDENAPTLSVMQADRLYLFRQKELLKQLAERTVGQPTITARDLQCVRRVHKIDDDPMFSYEAQHSPRKYTEAFVDWLLNRHSDNPQFFQEAREAERSVSAATTKIA